MKNKPLEEFLRLFPLTRVNVYDEDLIYRFRNPTTGKYFESLAHRMILDNGLALTAELQTWSSRGCVREISMVVKMAPDIEMVEI